MNTKHFWLLVFLLLIGTTLFAQVPQAINYQAVAYGSDGKAITNKQISVKLSIVQGNADGTIVYEETHQVQTANNGAFNLQIGTGTIVSGIFSAIDWSQSPYYIQFSLDTEGGSSYKKIATSQMLSVPYALYAERAGSVESGSSAEQHRFTVMPCNKEGGRLLTGQADIAWSDISLFVSYDDLQDQEATFSVEGLPSYIRFIDESQYGPMGVQIHLRVSYDSEEATSTVHQGKFVIQNKYGYKVEYPVQITTQAYNWESDPFGTEENINNELSNIIDIHEEYVNLQKSVNNAAFNDPSDVSLKTIYEKTYTPSSQIIYELWRKPYRSMSQITGFISELSSRNSPFVSENFKNDALAKAKIAKAYNYLTLTSWFGDVCIQPEVNSGQLLIPRTDKNEVLDMVIALLNEVLETNVSSENLLEAKILLGEAYLLKNDWQSAISISDEAESNTVLSLIHKIGTWKLSPTEEITESSLIAEYLDNFQAQYERGYLYLQALGYTATYFGLDQDNLYKVLLPIPENEINYNSAVTQNPGY